MAVPCEGEAGSGPVTGLLDSYLVDSVVCSHRWSAAVVDPSRISGVLAAFRRVAGLGDHLQEGRDARILDSESGT